jgi:hypothetical protein
MESELIDIFERTKRNCSYYEKEKKHMSLMNEIGCLRGIAYCLEAVGVCPHHDEEFLRLIDIQQKIKGIEDTKC